jgi:SAM-dependent methyltransferase
MSVLDNYVTGIPSAQNVVDIFDGEWSSRFPEQCGLSSRPGRSQLFADLRLTWAQAKLGEFRDARVLELGPLEGGHTYFLHENGAREIVAIEANRRAFLKCLCVKEIFDLQRARFLLGDFVAYLDTCATKFDVAFASGVLYHMAEPMRLLELLARCTDKLFIWTHYYDDAVIRDNEALNHRFSACYSDLYRDFVYEYAIYGYAKALDWSGFCGGPREYCHWLSRRTIIDFLRTQGFSQIDIGFDEPNHPNGPALAICARR